MKLTQHRKDVKRLRECQLSISLEDVADRYEEVIEELKRTEEERSRLSRLLIDERIFTTEIAEMIRRRVIGLGKGE